MLRPRRLWIDLLLLSALCGLIYFLAPTSHGLTNWQEAMRALVARQMHERIVAGEPWAWLVPKVWGEPYLAKPPVIYWCQLALARLTGGPPTELHLRLTVAIAGWLGVIGTYLLTRSLLREWPDPLIKGSSSSPPHSLTPQPSPWPDHAAWWSSLFLATGVLYARSSRIGELDILLVPTTIGAIWAIGRAWKCARARHKTDLLSLALAALFATLAVLTKGPPALLAIGLAAYGGMVLWAAFDPEAASPPRLASTSPRSLLPPSFLRIGGILIGIGAIVIGAMSHRWSFKEILGLLLMALMAFGALWLISRLAHRDRLLALWNIFKRTHPVGVLAVPALLFWGWGHLVSRLIGGAMVQAAAAEEAADNLQLFFALSPVNNLEAMAYGVGLGSIAAIIAAIWLIKDKPARRPGWYLILAWLILGYAAFSLLGKGVPRYLTPLWPAVAILGGMWMASALRDFKAGRTLAGLATALVVLLAAGQAWWYGLGREWLYPGRSPQAFVDDLLGKMDSGEQREKIATFEFSTPALDYYADRPIESFHDVVPRRNLRMVGPRTIADLHRDLAGTDDTFILLLRDTQPGGQEPRLARDCLIDAGFEVERIALGAPFTIDNGRTKVSAVRVRASDVTPPKEEPATDLPDAPR